MFARANSADLGNPWNETSFSVSDYKAINTPTGLGGELLANPGLEAMIG
jgi:hypothetical protein